MRVVLLVRRLFRFLLEYPIPLFHMVDGNEWIEHGRERASARGGARPVKRPHSIWDAGRYAMSVSSSSQFAAPASCGLATGWWLPSTDRCIFAILFVGSFRRLGMFVVSTYNTVNCRRCDMTAQVSRLNFCAAYAIIYIINN